MDSKWNYEKLERMTQEGNKYTKVKLDYITLAKYYKQIVLITRKNGEVIPLLFDDVRLAYNGNPLDDMNLPEIPEEFIEQYNQLENNRKVMHIKHFSRDISHEAWFDFISNEVLDFIEKYPQFKKIVKQ